LNQKFASIGNNSLYRVVQSVWE